MSFVYRFETGEGEGTFSATRRYFSENPGKLLETAVHVVKENDYWLLLPLLPLENLEFYWTEEGRRRYEHTFLTVQKHCLSDVRLISLPYAKLPGEVVYEDAFQIGIRANRDKSHLPNPYREPLAFCF